MTPTTPLPTRAELEQARDTVIRVIQLMRIRHDNFVMARDNLQAHVELLESREPKPESATATAPPSQPSAPPEPETGRDPVTCCGCGRTWELDGIKRLNSLGKDGKRHHLCETCDRDRVGFASWQNHLNGLNWPCATTSELKPCPFCGVHGARIKFESGRSPDGINTPSFHFVRCYSCRAETEGSPIMVEAVNHWNRRP